MVTGTKRKTFHLDRDVAYALETLSRDIDRPIDNLADEAIRDYLRKKGRPVTVEEALRESVRIIPANDRTPRKKPERKSRKR